MLSARATKMVSPSLRAAFWENTPCSRSRRLTRSTFVASGLVGSVGPDALLPACTMMASPLAGDGDLGVPEVPFVHELLLQPGLHLPEGEAAGSETTDEWIRERPVGFNG